MNGKGVYHRTGKWSDRAHFLQVDTKTQGFLVFICCIHLGIVLFEPPSFRSAYSIPYWNRMVYCSYVLIAIGSKNCGVSMYSSVHIIFN